MGMSTTETYQDTHSSPNQFLSTGVDDMRITEVNSEKSHEIKKVTEKLHGYSKATKASLSKTITGNFGNEMHYKLGVKRESFSKKGYGVGFASQADRFNKGTDVKLSMQAEIQKHGIFQSTVM